MTDEERTELDKLRAEVASLRQASNSRLVFKVSVAKPANEEKGYKATQGGKLSVYGLQRFPVSLAATQWETLLDNAPAIRAFIQAHRSEFTTKA